MRTVPGSVVRSGWRSTSTTTRSSCGGPRSIKLWVWVGLRNAGVEVDLAELTFDVGEVEEEKEDPGKAPSPDSDGSTSSTSSSSVE